MATANEKVTEFLSSAKDLMKTSKRMEDIFYAITKKNEKKICTNQTKPLHLQSQRNGLVAQLVRATDS